MYKSISRFLLFSLLMTSNSLFASTNIDQLVGRQFSGMNENNQPCSVEITRQVDDKNIEIRLQNQNQSEMIILKKKSGLFSESWRSSEIISKRRTRTYDITTHLEAEMQIQDDAENKITASFTRQHFVSYSTGFSDFYEIHPITKCSNLK